VWRGEAFGFLGPNGAGKSSTMRMIGCVSPRPAARCGCSAGPGHRRPEIRARLGVVPQDDSLDLELTVRKTCSSTALLRPVQAGDPRRADELLEFVQLTDSATPRSTRCPAA
jgi:lipooligosaccharide transport system ATP-binding protein